MASQLPGAVQPSGAGFDLLDRRRRFRVFVSNMLIFYLMAAFVGLVWGAILLRQTGLFGGCLALIVFAACFGHDFFNYSLGPLPITLDRVALGLLAICYVVARRLGWMPKARFDLGDMIFAAFLALLTINTFVHDWRVDNARPVARLLFLYIAPAVAYWLMREAAIDERRTRWLCGFLAVFGLYLAATAVAEVKQLDGVVFPPYILSSSYKEWLGRARGPFLNPVTNGMFLSAALFGATIFWPRASRLRRCALALGMAIIFLGVYCTLTRSCWLGAALGLGLILFAAVPQQFRVPWGITAVLLFGLVLFLKGNHLSSFKRDKDVSEFHMAQSAELRPMLAYVAWKITLDYPVFGCGLGQYKRIDRNYLHDPTVDMPLQRLKPFVQHNVFLSLLTETGTIGLGLYVLLLSCWCHRAWRLWRTMSAPLAIRQFGLVFLAFIANWCMNGMFHDTGLMINANLLLFMLAGTAEGLYVRVADHGRLPVRWPLTLAQARRPYPVTQKIEQGGSKQCHP